MQHAGIPLTALGRRESESAGHAVRAARAADWLIDDTDLLSLGSLDTTLATTSRLRDLGVVVRLGHAGMPDPELERALLEAPGSVMAVDSVLVPSRWTWAARTMTPRRTVVVDRVALAECGQILAEMDVIPRVVPSATNLRTRMELASDGSSIIVDTGSVPPDWVELPGRELLHALPPLWFGLVRNTTSRPPITGTSTVWLAFGPRIDETGSLMGLLDVFAEFDIDLSHLRSAPGKKGRHLFLSAFLVKDPAVLDALLSTLSGKKVQHRVLAILPGEHTPGAVAEVLPEWHPYE